MKCTHSRKPGSWSYDGCCSDCWVSRAEKAEADNAALRKLCLTLADGCDSAADGTAMEGFVFLGQCADSLRKAAAEGERWKQ
jgi:hypothetical protein